jgi:hypothetical protein
MPIKTRAHYLIFLLSWMVAFVLALVLAQENGLPVSREYILALLFLLSLIPAALGYLAVSRLLALYDEWRFRHGRDVYREDQYEDDAGFIHLNQKAARINKDEPHLAEILSDVGGATAEALNDDHPLADR